jgi:hypothetical protein
MSFNMRVPSFSCSDSNVNSKKGLCLDVGVCLMAAAFELSPWRLPGQVLQQLLDLVVAVVAGG